MLHSKFNHDYNEMKKIMSQHFKKQKYILYLWKYQFSIKTIMDKKLPQEYPFRNPEFWRITKL